MCLWRVLLLFLSSLRHLYSFKLAIDGNFKAKLKNRKLLDIPLQDGWSYFAPDAPFQAHTDKYGKEAEVSFMPSWRLLSRYLNRLGEILRLELCRRRPCADTGSEAFRSQWHHLMRVFAARLLPPTLYRRSAPWGAVRVLPIVAVFPI